MIKNQSIKYKKILNFSIKIKFYLSLNKMSFVSNTVRSPLDERDYILEAIQYTKIKLPKTLDYRNMLKDVRHQGIQGSCAAQSAACMKEVQERKQINFKDYMSPQFIYNNRSNKTTQGMFLRDVMKILQKKGCCHENLYPYGLLTKPTDIFDESLLKNALNHTIKSYASINTIEGVKKSLFFNGPCIIAVPVYHSGPNIWKKLDQNQKRTGGHAMTIVGYNKKGFIIRNSWGKLWGDDGYTIFPYEDFGLQWEIWTSIDEESDDSFHNKPSNCCR